MSELDYHLFQEVRDYPHKAGVLVHGRIMNMVKDAKDVNFKMEVSHEISDVNQLSELIDTVMEKHADLLITMFEHFKEIKDRKQDGN